jgi:DNA-binding HxlR family transcriptional regulator
MAKTSDVSLCPVVNALSVVGERWTLLILRDLFKNPSRRFQDFRESLTGCAPNTLSARLKTLEEHGLIERQLYEQHPPRLEYVLTDKGRRAGPVLRALSDWGETLRQPSDK